MSTAEREDRPSMTAPEPFPEILPIFPLAGVLLLPRARLPLNIFEPRYLAMTRDALGGARLIGMIQPSDPHEGGMNPAVYPTGCAGRITAFAETDDGRYLITLTGVSRFRIQEELPLASGYRRVVPEWRSFAGDLEPGEPAFDRPRLIRGLRAFFSSRGIETEWDAIEKAPGGQLVSSIAMLCPFAPNEKQALLDAADAGARAELLIALVEMAAIAVMPEGGASRH